MKPEVHLPLDPSSATIIELLIFYGFMSPFAWVRRHHGAMALTRPIKRRPATRRGNDHS